MTQRLKAPSLAEDPGLLSTNLITAGNYGNSSTLAYDVLFRPPQAPGRQAVHIHICKQNTHLQNKINV